MDGPPTAPRIAGGVGFVHVVGPAGADRVDHFGGLSNAYFACLRSGYICKPVMFLYNNNRCHCFKIGFLSSSDPKIEGSVELLLIYQAIIWKSCTYLVV